MDKLKIKQVSDEEFSRKFALPTSSSTSPPPHRRLSSTHGSLTEALKRLEADVEEIKDAILCDGLNLGNEIKSIRGELNGLVHESVHSPRTKILSRMDATIGNTQMLLKSIHTLMNELKHVYEAVDVIESRDASLLSELKYIRENIDTLTQRMEGMDTKIDHLIGDVDAIREEDAIQNGSEE